MAKKVSRIFLFRLRFHKDLLSADQGLENMMKAIEGRPRPRYEDQESVWLVGDVIQIDNESWYFEFGRTTSDESEYYDEDSGKFLETPSNKATHTLVYIDIKIQLVGIVHNPDLASDTSVISKRLERLIMKNAGFNITLGSIKDPNDFIDQIMNAARVKSFSVTYGLPNEILDMSPLYDAMTDLAKITGAETSTATVKSENDIVNRDQMAKISKNVNSLGYEVRARIQEKDGSQSKTISTSSNKANKLYQSIREEEETKDSLSIMDALRKLWQSKADFEDK